MYTYGTKHNEIKANVITHTLDIIFFMENAYDISIWGPFTNNSADCNTVYSINLIDIVSFI
jgi:hypothetical protein